MNTTIIKVIKHNYSQTVVDNLLCVSGIPFETCMQKLGCYRILDNNKKNKFTNVKPFHFTPKIQQIQTSLIN